MKTAVVFLRCSVQTRSETEFHAILKLERIRRVAGRAESQDRIGRLAQIYPSINGVQVRDVDTVEEVEKVGAELGADALVEVDLTCDSHIKSGETRPFERVPAQDARTIGERVAVAVRVRAGEDVEASAALGAQQRAELEVAQDLHARRDFADESQRVPVGHTLSRQCALRTDAGTFREVRKVGHRIRVGDGLGESVAAVNAEPVRESL